MTEVRQQGLRSRPVHELGIVSGGTGWSPLCKQVELQTAPATDMDAKFGFQWCKSPLQGAFYTGGNTGVVKR